MIVAFVRAWIRESNGADETCQVCTSHTLHRAPNLFQHPLLIALDQLIEQPGHGLDRLAPACGAVFRAARKALMG